MRWQGHVADRPGGCEPPAPDRQTRWRPSHRLVPSRFPPVGLFDRVAAPEDLDAVFELEAMTNDRLREEAGELALVPPEDRISGAGTAPIMAAFTHINPEGSRFSDGSFGVYYCAQKLETALSEVRYHEERFLLRTGEGPLRLELRLYLADLDARLVDVRRLGECHRPDDYASSRHARIYPDRDGQWIVEDLGSTNGTYLDRSRLTTPTPIPLGAPIRIGKTVIELRK